MMQAITVRAAADREVIDGNIMEIEDGCTSLVEYHNNDRNITPCYTCHIPDFYHETMRNSVKDNELKANF